MWDLIIVGGGAAGLWAAGTAAERGLRVLVLEKNRKPGVKILMSGGTRCNITHDCDVPGILTAFGSQGRFLKPALYGLPPDQVVQTINRLGVATKVEETGKVFPRSDRAIEVRDALWSRLTEAGAEIRPGTAVLNLQRAASASGPLSSQHWQVAIDGPQGRTALESSCVLLCTGGLSYPGCGTTGDGYPWASQAGHRIARTLPALTPLTSGEAWVHGLSGLTLPDVLVRVVGPGKKLKDARASSRSGLLWTHFGCSGPAAMNVSRAAAELQEDLQPAALEIDLVPDLDIAELERGLSATTAGNRHIGTLLNHWLPKRLAACLLDRAGTARDTRLAELRRAARQQLLRDLKQLSVPLTGTRGYAKAEVTAGGVELNEVNPRTMESRRAPGLYFAGEILDVDGPIGGFNFQAAFATAHLAATHAAATRQR